MRIPRYVFTILKYALNLSSHRSVKLWTLCELTSRKFWRGTRRYPSWTKGPTIYKRARPSFSNRQSSLRGSTGGKISRLVISSLLNFGSIHNRCHAMMGAIDVTEVSDFELRKSCYALSYNLISQ